MRTAKEIIRECNIAYGKLNSSLLRVLVSELEACGEPFPDERRSLYLGFAASIDNDFASAHSLLTQTIATAERHGNPGTMALAYKELAVLHKNIGDLPNAIEYGQLACSIAQEAESQMISALCNAELAFLYHMQGRFDEAIVHFNSSLKTTTAHGDEHTLGKMLVGLADCHRGKGQFEESNAFLQKALTCFESCGDSLGVATAMGSLGGNYAVIGDYPKALTYLLRAFKDFEEAGRQSFVAETSENIGATYHEAGLSDKAIEWLRNSILIHQQLGQPFYAAYGKMNLGVVYLDLGDAQRAVSLLNEALIEFHETGNDRYYYTQLILCRAHIELGRWEEANNLCHDLSEAVFSRPQFKGLHQVNLSQLAKHHGDIAEAERCLNKAIEIFESGGHKSEMLIAIGHLRNLAESCDDLKAYIKYNNSYQMLHDELRGSTTRIQIAMLFKEQEIEMERHERELEKLKHERLETSYQRQQHLLSSYASNLVRQIELVDELRSSILSTIRQSVSPYDAVGAIRERLDDPPTAESNWDKFYHQFSEINPDVEPNLRKRIPTITASELKVCCLLIMGMHTRDVATLLFVSERTVDNHRANIRKKLDIDRNDDLGTVLSVIAAE